MTKTTRKKLAYMKEYNKKPDEVDKRVARNRARRHAIADGKASVGDGTEVDHKVPLRKGGSTNDSNTRVVKERANAAWRKGKRGYDR